MATKDPDEELEEELEEESEEDEDDDDEPKGKSKTTKRISFTQDELTEKMLIQVNKGVRRGTREVLKELGFDSLEDAKKALGKDPKSKEDADDKNGQATAAAEAATKAAERVGKIATAESLLTRRLTIAQVNPEKLDAALKILGAEDHIDSDKDEADEAIEELKEKMPEFFKSEDDDEDENEDKQPRGTSKKSTNKRPAPRSTTGGKPRRQNDSDAKSKATDRLQRRHGAKLKQGANQQ